MKKMTMSGEWMTDREISGFAQLLGVSIFSCMETMPGKWSYQQFPHPTEIHVPTSGAIYIANIPRNLHFQVVLLPWNNKNCVKHLNSFTTSKRAREREFTVKIQHCCWPNTPIWLASIALSPSLLQHHMNKRIHITIRQRYVEVLSFHRWINDFRKWPIRWSEISVALGSVRARVYCTSWNDKQANAFHNNWRLISIFVMAD